MKHVNKLRLAIKKLEAEGWVIDKLPNPKHPEKCYRCMNYSYSIWRDDVHTSWRSAQEIVRWKFSEKPQRPWAKNLKHYNDAKNRRETRDLISRGDFDKIPQQGQAKEEDIWSWD